MRGKLLIIFLFLLLIIPLTACNPQQDTLGQAEQEQTNGPSSETIPSAEENYAGKIKEAKDYLVEAGLTPLKPLTQSPEGQEKTITWEDLAMKQEAMLLDAFLDRSIQKASEKKAYGAVDLRTVVFHLENERLAEVFFYEDRILGGVTYPVQQDQETRDYRTLKGESLAQIRNIDYPVWQAGQSQPRDPSIFYLQPKQASQDGFENALQVFSLGHGKILMILKKDLEIRAYVYDLETGLDFNTGISTRGDYLPIRVKPLQNKQVAVLLEDKMLIVDSDDFQTIREMNYPEEMGLDDIDISLDGQTIVASGKMGLIVYDGNFAKGKTIVPSKIGSDPHGLDSESPRYPVLSPDSSLILYRLCGYEWLAGTGTIALDGSKHRFFAADQEQRTYVKWYDKSHIFSYGSPYMESEKPVIRNINTGEETTLVKNAPKDKKLRYLQSKDQKLFFTLETLLDQNYNLKTVELGYYDLSSGVWRSLMESKALNHLDWYLLTYDPQENIFVFALGNYPLASRPAVLAGLP